MSATSPTSPVIQRPTASGFHAGNESAQILHASREISVPHANKRPPKLDQVGDQNWGSSAYSSPKKPKILSNATLAIRAPPPIHTITVLDLSYLGLTDVPGPTLEALECLEVLILGHNQLTDVSSVCDAALSPHLWTVDFSFNRLRSLKPFRRHNILGTVILSNNNLTWPGVAPFLENTCVSELYLEGNESLSRPTYRLYVVRMVLGAMVLDGRYVTVEERSAACALDATETIPLAPDFAVDKSGEPKLQDLQIKCKGLNKLVKRSGAHSKGTQLLSLIMLDLEERQGKRKQGSGYRSGGRKLNQMEGEKRRLRYLAQFYTACFSMLQCCPSQSLFEYSVGEEEPQYYSSTLVLGQTIAHCAEHAQLPTANLSILTNGLPFCISFWKEHPDAVQYLIQLFLASIQFDFDLVLVEEIVRRALLKDGAENPDKAAATVTVEIIARATGTLPPYARLSMLLLLSSVYPAVSTLLNDCMWPADEEYLLTLALSAHSMLIFLGFVTANEPESTGEYAVSGGGPEQPFAKDFALPAEFVQMSRHPRVAERQKARRRERDEAMHRQMQAERSEAEYLKAREEIRKAPPLPSMKPTLGPPALHEEKRQWLSRQQQKSWGGVAALDEGDAHSSAQFYTAYRMPNVGERVLVPFYSADGMEVMEKFFVIKELLQAQKLFRLLPMTISHKATQERAEKARRKEHQLVQRNRERDKKAPHIWTSSELGKGLQEVPSRPAKVLGTGVDVEASRDGPDDAILVGYNALVWNIKGYWKLVDQDHPPPGAADSPTTKARSATPSSMDLLPPAANNVVVEELSPAAQARTAAKKAPPSPTSPEPGSPGAKEEVDNTFLTGVTLSSPSKQDAPEPPADLAELYSQPQPDMGYQTGSSNSAAHADFLASNPQLRFHPFTREYMEHAARLKERMGRLMAQRPAYEPPINPVTGERACSATLAGSKKWFSWETQSNFFLPSLFRTKLVTMKMAPPAPPPAPPKEHKKPSLRRKPLPDDASSAKALGTRDALAHDVSAADSNAVPSAADRDEGPGAPTDDARPSRYSASTPYSSGSAAHRSLAGSPVSPESSLGPSQLPSRGASRLTHSRSTTPLVPQPLPLRKPGKEFGFAASDHDFLTQYFSTIDQRPDKHSSPASKLFKTSF